MLMKHVYIHVSVLLLLLPLLITSHDYPQCSLRVLRELNNIQIIKLININIIYDIIYKKNIILIF